MFFIKKTTTKKGTIQLPVLVSTNVSKLWGLFIDVSKARCIAFESIYSPCVFSISFASTSQLPPEGHTITMMFSHFGRTHVGSRHRYRLACNIFLKRRLLEMLSFLAILPRRNKQQQCRLSNWVDRFIIRIEMYAK